MGAEAGARLSRAGRALHGPRLPSSVRSGNGAPLGVPDSQEPGYEERPQERLRVGVWGRGAGCVESRSVRMFILVQSCGVRNRITWVRFLCRLTKHIKSSAVPGIRSVPNKFTNFQLSGCVFQVFLNKYDPFMFPREAKTQKFI